MKLIYNLFLFTILAGLPVTSAVAQPCNVIPPDSVDINSEAYLTVITNDPFCCDNYWDIICQNAYDNDGGNSGGGNPGGGGGNVDECITPPDNIDLESEAYANVILNDFFCCNVSWDSLCQSAYDNYGNTGGGNNGGGNWGGPMEGECIVPPATIDTSSYAYSMVIATDPFCCTTSWDNICTNAYNNFNGNGGGNGGGGTEPGDCVIPPADIDITSEAYLTVIANDPFCCNIAWDGVCQNSYTNFGNTDGWWGGGGNNGGPIIDGDCVIPPDGIDTESDVYGAVIAADPFCCNFNWDMICQNAYDNYGNPGGGNGGGGNTGGGYGPGNCAPVPAGVDTSSAAYAYVIISDNFCCNVSWDGLCQNAYDNYVGDEGGIIENNNISEATPNLTIDFSYYPNPTSGMLNVFFKNTEGNQPLAIKVYNTLGQIVYEKGLPSEATDLNVQLDLITLPAGIYLVSVHTNNNIVSKQLIKQ